MPSVWAALALIEPHADWLGANHAGGRQEV
jgi:hypothetical protein